MELGEKFLEEVGLTNLSEAQKREFLQRTQAELELRVGAEISKALTLEQIKEFEALADGNQQAIKKAVFEMHQDFRDDKTYLALLKRSGKEHGDWQVLGEYLSVRWIQKNCPRYKEIVAHVTEDLKQHIAASTNKP